MFTINRQVLAREFALLQTVAEKKGTIPILSSIKVECQGDLTVLTGTDLDATIISKVESSGEAWAGCVPLRQLFSLVKLLDGENLEFSERPNGRLEIKSGQSKHLIPFEPIERFPEVAIPKEQGVSLDGAVLGAMVKATAFWIRPSEDGLKATEWKQTGLSLRSDEKSLEVMSFRRTAAAIATLSASLPKFNVIIPRQAVSALSYFNEDLQMIVTENQVAFIGATRTLSARILEGEFPAWRTFLPTYEHRVEVPETFTDTIKRVSVTTEGQRATFEVLKLTIAKDSLKLESRGGDNGQSEEILPTTSTLNGKTVAIGIHGNQTVEALSRSDCNITCEFVDGTQPMIFTPANKDFELCYLTMPCRLEW